MQISISIHICVSISDRVGGIRNHQCGTRDARWRQYETPVWMVCGDDKSWIYLCEIWYEPSVQRRFECAPEMCVYIACIYTKSAQLCARKCINIFVGFLIVIEKHLPYWTRQVGIHFIWDTAIHICTSDMDLLKSETHTSILWFVPQHTSQTYASFDG